MIALRGSSQNASDGRHALRTPPRARPLVLVVEDDEDTRFLLRTLLGMRGYRVVEAVNGEDAVDAARSARPDLILMDGSLPRLDGVAATRQIRQLGAPGSVPIVFISGHAGPASKAVALEAGCDEYLVKPFDFDQLDGVLDKHLGRGVRVAAP